MLENIDISISAKLDVEDIFGSRKSLKTKILKKIEHKIL